MCVQGRRRSGRSGHYGRTTFLAENGLGRTTIFDYSAENVLAFATFFEVWWPNQLILSVLGQSARGCEDGRYKNNHENDTCIKDRYCHCWIETDYRLK